MHSNLRDLQLNRIYIYRLLYINLIITINQKSIIDTQKRERNPGIILKIVIKSQGKRAKEKKRNKKATKTTPKQQNVKSTYPSIITLNGLNAPIGRHRVTIYMLPTRDPLHT